MPTVSEILKKSPIIIVKLGAKGDDYSFVPRSLLRHTILLCLDAGAPSVKTGAGREGWLQKIVVREAVTGDNTPREFIERAWWGCSSLLEIRPDQVQKYGHQALCEEKSRTPVMPVTLAQVLKTSRLDYFDVLITDLEGLDLGVIKSCGALLDSAALIQSELRFEPYYEGEPRFHEALAYLSERNFDLIGIRPEYWKPVSKRRDLYTDGTPAWADCLFLNNLYGRTLEGDRGAAMIVKRILLLSMLGKPSLAAHLLEKHHGMIDARLSAQLNEFLNPDQSLKYFLGKSLSRCKGILQDLSRFLSARRFPGTAPKSYGRTQSSNPKLMFPHVAHPEDNL